MGTFGSTAIEGICSSLLLAKVPRYGPGPARIEPAAPASEPTVLKDRAKNALRALAAMSHRQPARKRGAPPEVAPLRPALAMFLFAAIVIAWPWLSGRVTIPWDAKAHFQPQIQFLAHSIADGLSPFWAPFVFSGHPQIADPQSMMFSPPFLVLALLTRDPSLRAVDATVFAAIFVGGAALMLWFRDRGWHWAGGLIAALAFSFGASMAWRIQHIGQVLSLAYLPMAMLCLERALAAPIAAVWIGGGRGCRVHRAGTRPGCPARRLCAGGVRRVASGVGRRLASEVRAGLPPMAVAAWWPWC